MQSRRDVCVTGALSAFIIAHSVTIAKSVPAVPLHLRQPDLVIPAQQFALPNFKSREELGGYLDQRFAARAKSRNVVVTEDGQKEIRTMIEKSMSQVFVEEKLGSIDKSRQYQNLPIPVRQAITIRNLDTISDLAIVAAERENEKMKKGKLITAAIVQSIRDFVCPMFPFCTA